MAQLKNELSWSRSRMSTLHACKRQYFYQYYQKWGGWNWNAPQEAKDAYLLSKMSSLPAMVGDAVHQAIKRILIELAQTGEVNREAAALFARKNILSQRWLDAKDERWKQSASKFPPVFELYYDNAPSPEELKNLGVKVIRCLDTLLDSDFFSELQSDNPEQWLMIDPELREAPTFRVGSRVVWAIPDFVRKSNGHTIEIWDWKTGRKSPHDHLQLLSYALYARDVLDVPAKDIRLYGFYLDPEIVEDSIIEYECSDAELEMITNTINADLETMESMLVNVAENVPKEKEEHFPMTDDYTQCKRCNFKELCQR